ncbi:hypothetical protein SeMB42_g01666 [Synchytrium endobioticum]|uniref:Signal recognition particle subunit SRP72 n=1 Tax=Synchytrium endobioticum TaxID=286115 RepID=A0A507DMG3_9FUNG|nr:hypothetical protein SeLEV6574_g02233 [Synchytrium endobioticum]TPX52080.1 hypothetical protein SeMB42_g01666 [Synchytrium endobioticum]
MPDQTSLWAELQRLCEAAEHDKAIRTCDKLLKALPGDIDALHVKVTALSHLDRFHDALSIINTIPSPLRKTLVFEEAYSLYRAENLHDCLELIHGGLHNKDLPAETVSALERLLVQVLYRKESYAESWDIAKAVIDKIDENNPYYTELSANLAGIEAAAALSGVKLDVLPIHVNDVDTYELAYNLACAKIASGNLDQAQTLLEKARKLCRDLLIGDEQPEQDIEKELAIIVVQLGFVCQLQGRVAEALDLYQGVLKSKVGDTAVTAVASNNTMALKKDHELFDSAKRHRAAATAGLETKLTTMQKKVIALNGAVLSMYMNKPSVARDVARGLLATYPDDDQIYLILAAIALREHKASKAIDELVDRANTSPKSLPLQLALTQLYLLQKNIGAATSTMERYLSHIDATEKYKPGLVSLMVWLYSQTGSENGMKMLEEATPFWPSLETGNKSISRQLATFKLKSNRPHDAAADFERLVKADPSDVSSVAGLIMSYSEFNPALAEQYQSYLPRTESVIDPSDIDVDALETSFTLGRLGAKRAGAVASAETSTPAAPKEKKKRKRKIRLPKNYDPNVLPDPERWLPKRDRSTFQPKKGKKKDLAKGSQGSATSGGGIGMTGSARIAGMPVPEPIQQPAATSTTPPEKKKKIKGKKR